MCRFDGHPWFDNHERIQSNAKQWPSAARESFLNDWLDGAHLRLLRARYVLSRACALPQCFMAVLCDMVAEHPTP